MAALTANKVPKATDGTHIGDSQITDDGTTVTIGTSGSAVTVAGVVQPKVYVALLTQSGTNDPVATVLVNTLGGTVVWARTVTGNYTATLVGAFTTNKTVCLVTPGESVDTGAAGQTPMCHRSSSDIVNFKLTDVDGSAADYDSSAPISIEFRVYP